MKIVVLGCGPAGLMGAQGAFDALTDHGAQGDFNGIAIVSRKQKSPIHGCQYLHKPIPRVTPNTPVTVAYQLRGDSDDYRRKVYGPLWSGSVSPEDLMGEHRAWDIRETYDRLWFAWQQSISHINVDPIMLEKILSNGFSGSPSLASAPDLVINSIPRPALCHAGHAFGATEVWAAGDAPTLGIRVDNLFHCPDDMVICNAEDNPAWYRLSRVFGHTTIEWPGALQRVPVTTAARVSKPTQHSCDCWEGAAVTHVGRYGRWEKGVLSHSAYFDAYKKIDEMLGGKYVASTEAAASVPEV